MISSPEGNLSEVERQHIKDLMEDIEELASKIIEPIDPKVEGLLEIAFAMLVEQLEQDKKYEYGDERQNEDDKFLFLDNEKDNDTPSADELSEWYDK